MKERSKRKPPLLIYTDGSVRDITGETTSPVYTFGFVKPHAYHYWREIMSDIESLSRERDMPLVVICEKERRVTRDEAERHYRAHRERIFFDDLIRTVTEGPTRQFILTGSDAINSFREIVGATDPEAAGKNTIRGRCATGKYGERKVAVQYNAIHGSDNVVSLIEEVNIHFGRTEVNPEFWQRVDSYSAYLQALRRFNLGKYF
ncbi:MAG: hypothetical protein J4469_04455 [Candidatus Aenigmarchaeota archaeon]|nr:hypothetical protein [Candidatus Aenigmarchaeota archaeon]